MQFKRGLPDRINNGVAERYCPHCGEWKTASLQHFRRQRDGLTRTCKSCLNDHSAPNRSRQEKTLSVYDAETRAEIKARQKQWIAIIGMAPWTGPRYSSMASKQLKTEKQMKPKPQPSAGWSLGLGVGERPLVG